MRKVGGMTLEEILYNGTIVLNTEMRKAICIAIIKSYIERVELRGLVHNDIAPKI